MCILSLPLQAGVGDDVLQAYQYLASHFLRKNDLNRADHFAQKCLQFDEVSCGRHNLGVVGATTVWGSETDCKIMLDLNQAVPCHLADERQSC